MVLVDDPDRRTCLGFDLAALFRAIAGGVVTAAVNERRAERDEAGRTKEPAQLLVS
ncbi:MULTISPECIES: hypothetical protein [Streptomyces]|uniref:hypothetical protein n=1 Tax=Streptomyces TaxID=1883 RepID=UPI0024A3E415|nr:hypothetical protein [Streptomyces lavendulae]WSW01794.1 hypothetical protein OG509_39750 [Streptomyces sp. NBC_01006]GLW04411.1 hypothetical protein Slala05_80410 [Streptomyces lavendulae subsp. lavendulae]